MGVVEDDDENEEKLTKKILQILESKAGVKLEASKFNGSAQNTWENWYAKTSAY